VTVTFSFPCGHGNKRVLTKLKALDQCDMKSETNSESVALWYAAYQFLMQKISSDTNKILSQDLYFSTIDMQDSSVIWSFTISASASKIKKLIYNTIRMGCDLQKCYQMYSKFIKILGMKPDKNVFQYILSETCHCMANVNVFISGKTSKLKQEHVSLFSNLLESTMKDTVDKQPKDKGVKPEREHSDNNEPQKKLAIMKKFSSNHEAAKMFLYLSSKYGNSFVLDNDSIIDKSGKINFDSIKASDLATYFDKAYQKYSDKKAAINWILLTKALISKPML
jgi:hypothetical protein